MRRARVSRHCAKIRAATGVEGTGEIEKNMFFLCSKVVVVVTSDMDADAINQSIMFPVKLLRTRFIHSMTWLDLNAAAQRFPPALRTRIGCPRRLATSVNTVDL